MISHLDTLNVLQSAGDQHFTIQILLCLQQLRNGGLGLGVLGGKDGATVLIRQDGSFHCANLTGDGNNLFLIKAD